MVDKPALHDGKCKKRKGMLQKMIGCLTLWRQSSFSIIKELAGCVLIFKYAMV